LRARPITELFSALQLPQPKDWPLTIPCGLPLPKQVSVEKSSQFASGFLLAAAAQLWLKKQSTIRLSFLGEMRSEPYLALTKRMLEEAGIRIDKSGSEWQLTLSGEIETKYTIQIEKDATALAGFELLAMWEGLGTLASNRVSKEGEQGDWRFRELLEEFLRTEKPISLRDMPDLAPTFFVASILYQKQLIVIDTPQLHDKECDRARAIVAVATALGIPAEERSDGFSVSAQDFTPPKQSIVLPTMGDHRMAMAIGFLSYLYPEMKPDNQACVAKSFPDFWQLLQNFTELLL
jgi:3-phosphoshikimate 1-carboxyvinyltransferase